MQHLCRAPTSALWRPWEAHHTVCPAAAQATARASGGLACGANLAARPACRSTSAGLSAGPTAWTLEPVPGAADRYFIRATVRAPGACADI